MNEYKLHKSQKSKTQFDPTMSSQRTIKQYYLFLIWLLKKDEELIFAQSAASGRLSAKQIL